MTAQGHTEDGLKVLHKSVAEILEDTTLSGNTPGDLECDSSSLVFGDLTGVASNKCAQAEPNKKDK